MAIPDFQTLMLPLLALHEDGGEHTQSDLRDALAAAFGLTPEELEQRLPSGLARTFVNRVGWTSSHLAQARLLEKPRRGVSRITERGLEVLHAHPERVDMTVLENFEEYRDFRTRASGRRRTTPTSVGVDTPPPESGEVSTPEEQIDAAHHEIRDALADEILGRLLERDDRFFENVVLDVLLALGYGGSKPEAASRLGQSGDGGVDGIIRQDQLGLDAIYVQAKKWAASRIVGPREIREFIGALQDVEALKGVFITTSAFSNEARQLARRRRIVLIDGMELAGLMVDSGVGATTARSYEVKKIDEDYFVDQP